MAALGSWHGSADKIFSRRSSRSETFRHTHQAQLRLRQWILTWAFMLAQMAESGSMMSMCTRYTGLWGTAWFSECLFVFTATGPLFLLERSCGMSSAWDCGSGVC